MKITEYRAYEILCWLDDQAGDHTNLFEQMTLYRDAAALIRQLRDAEQSAWHAGLDAGREQGRSKDHAHPPPSAPVGVEGLSASLRDARERMIAALGPRFGEAFDGDFDVMRDAADALAQQTAAVDGLAARLVDELDGLVSESDGVSGLHLNGDVASWEELLPGGRFERLSSLDELREALAAKAQPKRRPYNASGSLSEYGVFPECDAQQPAAVDEAMVERALAAYLRRQEDGESLYGCVTAAMTAALAAQPGGSDNDR